MFSNVTCKFLILKALCIQPFTIIAAIAFGVTVFISLDVGLGITKVIGDVSDPPAALRSISLFILTNIWPPAWVFIFHIKASFNRIYIERHFFIFSSCCTFYYRSCMRRNQCCITF